MKEFIRIGVDLAKNYFQFHALESEDGHAAARKLSRQAMHKFFSETKPCLVGMEACGSALLNQTKGLGARTCRAMGHEVRLIPPIYVKPCVKRGKNDDDDAAAICEAMARRGHALRAGQERGATSDVDAAQDAWVADQAADHGRQFPAGSSFRVRPEFGIVAAKGIGRAGELIEKAGSDATLPETAKAALKILAQHLEAIDASSWASRRGRPRPTDRHRSCTKPGQPIAGGHSRDRKARRFGDRRQRAGLDQFSSRGATFPHRPDRRRSKILAAAKRSSAPSPNRANGRLLVLGATSLLHVAGKRKGALRNWLAALPARKPARLVTVALANKLARIIWAVMTAGEAFRTETFERAWGNAIDKLTLVNFQFGEGETDMMNETAGIDAEGHPLSCHARKARILDWDLRGRTSSGPAEKVPRQKAGHMTASRRNVQNVRKTTCQSGPSTYDNIESASPNSPQEMNGKLWIHPAVPESSSPVFYTFLQASPSSRFPFSLRAESAQN
jgi:transposase